MLILPARVDILQESKQTLYGFGVVRRDGRVLDQVDHTRILRAFAAGTVQAQEL
jgi:hypothetical protein